MPRTRKPQVARPAGRVASTTTGATRNVPSPVVYRIPTGRRDYGCETQIIGSGVAPIHVRWIDDHEFQVSINETELKGKIENWENLDLTNVNVTLNEIDGPVTITGNLNVEEGTFAADEVVTALLTANTGTVTTLNSTDLTATSVDANDVTTVTLETSSDATIGGTLGVTGEATFDTDVTVSGNETVEGTLDVTGATTVTELTATTSVTTVGLIATGDTTLAGLEAGETTVDALTTTNGATIGTTLDVTGDSTFGGNVEVTGDVTITGETGFTGDVTTANIASTGTATLNDVNVGGNESVTGTLSVTGNGTFSSALTASGNTAVGGNLSVAGNSTITGTSTTTGNAIFNSDVTVAGNESVTGSLTVADDVTLANDLVVNGTTNIKALETDGSVDIDGTLRVTGAINGSNGATIHGQVESDTVRTGEVIADEVRVSTGLYLSNGAEAPDFVLQVEKGKPGGVAVLDDNGVIPTTNLPAIFTTCILKIVPVVFENSNTAVLKDSDIMLDGSQWLSNYQDIIGDIDPTIHEGEIILTSNEVETGSVHVNIAYPVDRCAQYNQNNQSGGSTEPIPDADLSGADPLP